MRDKILEELVVDEKGYTMEEYRKMISLIPYAIKHWFWIQLKKLSEVIV